MVNAVILGRNSNHNSIRRKLVNFLVSVTVLGGISKFLDKHNSIRRNLVIVLLKLTLLGGISNLIDSGKVIFKCIASLMRELHASYVVTL